jgi:hypothetical protein
MARDWQKVLAPFYGKRCSISPRVPFCAHFEPYIFDEKNSPDAESMFESIIGRWKIVEEELGKGREELVMFGANSPEGEEPLCMVDGLLFYDRETGETYVYEEASFTALDRKHNLARLKFKVAKEQSVSRDPPRSAAQLDTHEEAFIAALSAEKYDAALKLLGSRKIGKNAIEQRMQGRVAGLDTDGQFTCLHWACFGTDDKKETTTMTKLVARLLELGADTEVTTPLGETPLMIALGHMRWSIAEVLLERGANPLAVDLRGLSVLHWCCSRGHLAAIEAVRIAERLLERGADITLKSKKPHSAFDIQKGETPLMIAERCRHKQLVKLLKAWGKR